MLLVIAVLFLAVAAFAFGEAATYPARLKQRLDPARRRATGACASRHEPTRASASASACSRRPSQRLAAIPLRLNPRTSVEAIGARLLAAGLAQRITPAHVPRDQGRRRRSAALFSD